MGIDRLGMLIRQLANSNFTENRRAALVIEELRAFASETGRDAAAIEDRALEQRAAAALERVEAIANGQ